MNPAAVNLHETQSAVNLTPKQLRNFWKKVDKNGPIPQHKPELGPCWIWIGSKSVGYGAFRIGKKSVKAHRISYEIKNGKIQEGLDCLHHCDNPPCINPDHLFPGTHAENMSDRDKKGRLKIRYGSENTSRLMPEKLARGEAHGLAKLNWEKVKEIRRIYSLGGSTFQSLGDKFGVSSGTIHSVILLKTWIPI